MSDTIFLEDNLFVGMYIQFDKSISANLRLHLTRTTHLVFSERALQSPSSLHRYLLLTSPEFSPLKQGARSSRAPRPCPRPATCMPHLPYVWMHVGQGQGVSRSWSRSLHQWSGIFLCWKDQDHWSKNPFSLMYFCNCFVGEQIWERIANLRSPQS